MQTSRPASGSSKNRERRQERKARATLGQLYAQVEEKHRLQVKLGKRRRHLVRVIQRLEPASKEDRATAMTRLVLLNKKEANRKEGHQQALRRRAARKGPAQMLASVAQIDQALTELWKHAKKPEIVEDLIQQPGGKGLLDL